MSDPSLAFELYRYRKSDLPQGLADDYPRLAQALCVEGVPKIFTPGMYVVDPVLEFKETKSGRILKFGTTERGLPWLIGVRVGDGNVIKHIDHQGRPIESFVNSSIGKFTDTVHAVMDRFPYYDDDAEWDELIAAGKDLLAVVSEIDPDAAVADRYWSTFVDDVINGDFSTQDILGV